MYGQWGTTRSRARADVRRPAPSSSPTSLSSRSRSISESTTRQLRSLGCGSAYGPASRRASCRSWVGSSRTSQHCRAVALRPLPSPRRSSARFAAWYSRERLRRVDPRRGTGAPGRAPAPPRRRTGARAPSRAPVIFIVAEAGERADALAQVGGVGRLRPHALRLAVVLLGDDRAQLLHALRHRAGEAVDRRASRGTPPRARPDPWTRSRLASSPPIRSFSFCGPANAVGTVTCWSSAKPMRSASGSVAMSRFASSESVK